ncbi:C1 peptidase-like protein [Aureococcus anophagefferens]|nr:C1 peptidase-like protein [Aureococcus anophagefferens]
MDEYGSKTLDDELSPLTKEQIRPCARWRGATAMIAVGAAAVIILGVATNGGHIDFKDAATDDAAAAATTEVVPLAVVPDVEYTAAEDAEWIEFKARFRKSYASPEDEALKRSYYHARVAELAEKNALNGSPVFGVTAHADRAPGTSAFARGRKDRRMFETYKDSYEKFDVDEWRSKAKNVDWEDGQVDWRKVDDVLTPVKNQGQCGSCWAFSTTEQVESQFYLAGGPPVVLSAQQALTPDEECLGPFCTNACDMDLSELVTEYDYIGPYATVEGYAFATDPCGEGLCADQDLGELAKTIQATPAAVCVNAGAWDDYTGGVLRYDACSGAYADIDHCVQLVGYDATGEEPYWIVRNSWSTSWGEDGYIRLQMDANTCGVADEATVAKVGGVW